ncbi:MULTISPECIES: PTS sugar transporter subunit IIA [Lactobacillaceae]|uniref:PTS sugar transporter subunit IIA n=1 Tax=Lactobacillaceae TaxID=33958 RepID=UPI0008636E1D|nr:MULTISPECIES: PTS fructose transporter subunit IIA [Lactobacillaceae]APB86758.1 PTS fructose transporter subunit IIA [Lactiplantibacillus plantarum]ARO01681.1 PTS fructose transporter subunit IIA [Lactiplantibacillus plantarum]ARO02294.1 PTS fructose transporter subunit IIA [Lactiplantibacillus plantarum]ARO04588.1 PTS fructose transporter subunit IIA [Lactiplantibacillus plantarum]ARO05266.1 PTS fructose transporter subunit IIA [Lactiplantibacillus plantarum]
MKYLLLVSHGDFSSGLKQTLSMFSGDAIKTVLAVGLKSGEAIATFGRRFEGTLAQLPDNAQFIVLADIIGGSPLTTVCNVLSQQGKLRGSFVLGGMNFPMALTALMSKDTMNNFDLKQKLLTEATGAIKPLDIEATVELSDDDI